MLPAIAALAARTRTAAPIRRFRPLIVCSSSSTCCTDDAPYLGSSTRAQAGSIEADLGDAEVAVAARIARYPRQSVVGALAPRTALARLAGAGGRLVDHDSIEQTLQVLRVGRGTEVQGLGHVARHVHR